MFSIVGLGNPGIEYSRNRHNAGYMAVDEITSYIGIENWKLKNKSHISKGSVNDTSVVFLKPKTFMNLSGNSVKETINFYKIPSKNVIVIHDDLDLELGKIKAKFGGGNAGHNGLGNISQLIGNDYYRLRIGIGHPGKNNVSKFVLEDFKDDELIIIKNIINYIKENINLIINNDLQKFNQNSNNY